MMDHSVAKVPIQPRPHVAVSLALFISLLIVGPAAGAGSDSPSDVESLVLRQTSLADRFRRLEELLLRRAEVSAREEPEQAELLLEAVRRSQRQAISQRFEEIARLLRQDSVQDYRKAEQLQTLLDKELNELLELLLSEDRAGRLDAEQQRFKQYLEWVNRLLRMQKSLQGQTETGGAAPQLAERQGELGSEADAILQKMIEAAKRGEEESEGGSQHGAAREGTEKSRTPAGSDMPRSDSPPGRDENGRDGDRASEEELGNPSPGEGGAPREQGEGQPREAGEGSDSQSPPEGGSPSPRSGEGQPSQGGGDEGGIPDSNQGEPPSDADRQTRRRVQAAREHMENARRQLEQARREGALKEQEEAVRNLEEAKAELEKILRQLREEEMERLLARLEPRLRQMLEAQRTVYEGTERVAAADAERLGRDVEVEAGRLAQKEREIVLMADRALMLMREEGTAVALPEALTEARGDMVHVAENLARADVGELTRTIQQDILAALEEMLAAVEKAQRDLEEGRRNPPQRSQDSSSELVEMPLVDSVQELKMIRSLQVRINRRTDVYTKLIAGERAEDADILEGLARLAQTQDRLRRLTRDIVLEKNQ